MVSLQVWMPLNGNLDNQGLSDIMVFNSGATVNNSGKIGKCYYFDGTDDRIYANNISIDNKEMSACVWVNFTTLAPNNYPYIFALGSNTSGTGIQLGLAYWKSDSKIHLVGNGYEGATNYTPPTNTWVHLCITIKGSESRLYVNGVLTSILTNSNQPKTQTCLCIGARPNSTNGAGSSFLYPINGYLNDFRLYDEALSPKEVEIISRGLVRHYQLCDPTESQISSTMVTNNEPYHYRKTGDIGDINDCKSSFTTIIGGSLGWNQQFPAGDVDGSWPSGSTHSYNSTTGVVTYNATMPNEGYGYVRKSFNSQTGHVYLTSFRVKNVGGTTLTWIWSKGNNASTTPPGSRFDGDRVYFAIQKSTSNATLNIYGVSAEKGTVVSVEMSDFMCIDLTLLFGSTIADYISTLEQTGVGNGYAWFKKYFPLDYYPYSAPTLQHVGGLQNIKRKGKNLIDAFAFETRTINGITFTRDGAGPDTIVANGTSASGTTPQVYCTFTPKITGQYLFSGCPSGGSTGGYDIYCWDTAANARAKGWDKTTNSASDYGNGNVQIWLEEGKLYALECRIAGNRTVSNVVFRPMIRFASVTDATFEPRTITTNPLNYNVALDSNVVLRGVPRLDSNNNLYFDGDTYSADGTVTRRYGIVDLGTLPWGRVAQGSIYLFMADIAGMQSGNVYSTPYNDIGIFGVPYTYKSTSVGWSNMVEDTYGCVGINLRIRDDSYSTTDAFKTAMSGKYIVYELAEPTTETAISFISPQIASPYGSEEFVTTSIMPVGHETKYSSETIESRFGRSFENYLTDIGVDGIEYDVSGYGNNGIKNGELTSSSNTPRYELSAGFTGTQYITAESLPAETKTISCWVKTTKSKSTSQIIIGDYNSKLCMSFYSGNFLSYFSNSGYSTGSRCTLGSEYKENDWNHFVVIATGSGTRDVYCNGVKLTPTTNDYWSGVSGLTIGKRNNSTPLPFYGYLSDFRAYATALTQEQILDLYHSSASLANNGTLLSYEFVEGGEAS